MTDAAAGTGRLRARLPGEIAKEMVLQSIELAEYVKERHLTGGTTSTRLHVRTGKMRASTRPAPIKRTAEGIEGGINVGTIYAPMHFGRAGSKTTIRPKKAGGFLAIPQKAALTPAGVSRGAPRSGVFGETFPLWVVGDDGKKRLFIFGKRVTQRGARAGQARGKIVPLFLLVKKVEIPARVDPEAILRWWKPRVIRALGKVVLNVTAEVR